MATRSQALQSGASAFLGKPFNDEALSDEAKGTRGSAAVTIAGNAGVVWRLFQITGQRGGRGMILLIPGESLLSDATGEF
jgi:hypothetical protein